MTKTFTIAGNIDEQLLHELSDFYNELKEGDKVYILLSSDGGSSHYREGILTILGLYQSITCLIGYGCLSSAAFELFFHYTGERQLTNQCSGMYHRARASYAHDTSGGVPDEGDKYGLTQLKKYHREYAEELCKSVGMHPKDIKKIESGKDAYFNYGQMKEFLLNSIKSQTLNNELPGDQETHLESN